MLMPQVLSHKINEMAKDRKYLIMRDRLIPKKMKAQDYYIFDDEPKLKLPDGRAWAIIEKAWAKNSKRKCKIQLQIRRVPWNNGRFMISSYIRQSAKVIHTMESYEFTEDQVIPYIIQMIDHIIKTFQAPASTCSLCNKLMLSGPLGNICKDNDLHCEECIFRC